MKRFGVLALLVLALGLVTSVAVAWARAAVWCAFCSIAAPTDHKLRSSSQRESKILRCCAYLLRTCPAGSLGSSCWN